MIPHAVLAITSLITSAKAGILPLKRTGGLFDFDVRYLEAQEVVMSERNYINFHIRPYPGAKTSHCFALGTTLSHTLTTIPQTWCYSEHNDDSTAPSRDRVWFMFIIGEDVDPNAPTVDSIFVMHHSTGAYLRIARQVDDHTHDMAMQYFPAAYLPVVGEGPEEIMAHQVYDGPQSPSIVAVRYQGVAH
ncbi:hypothetical protein N657DRAFT_660493 [Parathielavia appendiculata]|uniref:Uncharacterized protein n=1 Tax=Parathielavia appendiculata TaxID=2587402 RepID=A0AAN6Z8L4_9PEZI|nr:hypothetical protein N657DRAFT_660493 [Parathielavia appendiculata]